MYQSRTWTARCAALWAIVVMSPALVAGEIEVIYSNIPGHPTAVVPGTGGESFRSPLAPFLALYGSPNGEHWIFKGFTDNPDSAANDVIVVGSKTDGAAVAKEGDAAPLMGLTYGFMDSDCGINDSGHYVFGNRLSGGSTTTDEVLLTYNGLSIVAAFREGDAAPGLFDPNGAGNELFGNSLNSAHVLADGTVGCKADLIQNIHTDYESALYHGATLKAQEGTSLDTLVLADVYDSFIGLSGNTFSSSADGSGWIVEADALAGVGTDEVAVVNSAIVVRDGDLLEDFPSPVDAIFAVDMAGNGDWFVRGDFADNDVWALRNGVVIAATGEPITTGNTELYTDSIPAVNGNTSGDYVVVGATDNADPLANVVAVLNGETVIARTGDPVILPGAGPATVVYLHEFDGNDVFLSDDFNDDLVDDRELYIFGAIRDNADVVLGDAFVVVRLADTCPWDCADGGNGEVDTVDFFQLIAEWGQVGVPCDFDGDGVSTVDFFDLIGHWGLCP
jgi:hypothetical protein